MVKKNSKRGRVCLELFSHFRVPGTYFFEMKNSRIIILLVSRGMWVNKEIRYGRRIDEIAVVECIGKINTNLGNTAQK